MPVTIDEVTTEILASESGSAAAPPSGPAGPASPEADRRKWSEQLQRQANRSSRVNAD
jgi:hypothetical protein